MCCAGFDRQCLIKASPEVKSSRTWSCVARKLIAHTRIENFDVNWFHKSVTALDDEIFFDELGPHVFV